MVPFRRLSNKEKLVESWGEGNSKMERQSLRYMYSYDIGIASSADDSVGILDEACIYVHTLLIVDC